MFISFYDFNYFLLANYSAFCLQTVTSKKGWMAFSFFLCFLPFFSLTFWLFVRLLLISYAKVGRFFWKLPFWLFLLSSFNTLLLHFKSYLRERLTFLHSFRGYFLDKSLSLTVNCPIELENKECESLAVSFLLRNFACRILKNPIIYWAAIKL